MWIKIYSKSIFSEVKECNTNSFFIHFSNFTSNLFLFSFQPITIIYIK